VFVACQQNKFAGNAAKRGASDDQNPGLPGVPTTQTTFIPTYPPGITPGGGAPGAGVTPTFSPTIVINSELDSTTVSPRLCDGTNVAIVASNGNCPKNFAAYTADDSSGGILGCCPLPVNDILLETASSQIRGGSCLANEIATGVSGDQLVCTPINTAKYRLSSAKQSCYFGDGASGSGGSADCGTIPAAFNTIVSGRFGSDACVAVPYGAVIVSKTSKYCRNITGAQILFADSNLPVPSLP
jgi:hypothetical protein